MTKENGKPQIRFTGFCDTWEQRKLSDLGEIITGSTPKTNDVTNYDGEFLFVSPADIQGNRYIEKTITTLSEKGFNTGRHIREGASLFVSIGSTIGKVAQTLEKSVTNQQINALASSENYDDDFIFTLLETQSVIIKSIASNQAVPIVNKTTFGETEVMVPKTKKEQVQIGDYFNNLDNLITLHQRKYDKLINVKKSILEKMFPRNDTNVPEIRFKGFSDAWEQRKLWEIATMHARIGWQNLRTSEFLDSGDYMLITGTDFEDGAINYSTCHYVEKERYEQDKHIQINNGSILITKDGTLGKVAYVKGLTMPTTLNAGVFNVEIKDKNVVDSKYLFQYLKAPYLMDYVGQKATGGTIKHLNQNILVDFPVVLPDKEEQSKIGEYFQGIDNLITLHQRKLEKLKNLKKACLEKMFV